MMMIHCYLIITYGASFTVNGLIGDSYIELYSLACPFRCGFIIEVIAIDMNDNDIDKTIMIQLVLLLSVS